MPYFILALALLLLSTAAQSANPSLCGGESPPAVESPYVFRCASDFGVYPNTGVDVTGVLQRALDQASQLGAGLYLPSGDYVLGGNVLLRDKNTVLGSNLGITRFLSHNRAGVTFGDDIYANVVGNLLIEHIVFENVTVRLYGRKAGNKIRHNAFVNSRTRGEQLFVSHYPYEIVGNVFMRGPGYPGLGLSTYRNTDTLIEGNFLGSPAEAPRAAGYLDEQSMSLIARLEVLAAGGALTLDIDQGNFVSGWYATDGLKDSRFQRNYFSGNKLQYLYNASTGAYDIVRDHNVYIKQYQNIDVLQNYFAGWPLDAAGQVKFRNAEGLTFAANYLDGLSFNARPYDDSSSMFMRETYVFNNSIRDGVVSYWQNFTDAPPAKVIDVSNYLVFGNRFEASMGDYAACRVSGTKRNISGQFFEADNRYDVGPAVVVCDFSASLPLADIQARLPALKQGYLSLPVIAPR